MTLCGNNYSSQKPFYIQSSVVNYISEVLLTTWGDGCSAETLLSPWTQTKLRDGTWVLEGGISDPAETKWCQPLSYHMTEFNLFDPHVLKPVEQSKGAADEAQGRPRGLLWTASAYNETEGFLFAGEKQ